MAARTTAPARTNGKTAERRVIDVDAHRAARLEKLGPPPVVRVGGRDVELPLELPADVIYAFGALSAGDLTALESGLRGLLGDAYDVVVAEAPAFADLEFVITEAMEAYGVAVPER